MMKIIIIFLLLASIGFAEVTGDTVPLTITEETQNLLTAETIAPETVLIPEETPPFPPTANEISGNDATILGFVSLVAIIVILYVMWKMIRRRGKRGKPRTLKSVKTVKVFAA